MLKPDVPVRHVEKSKMRLCVFPIFRIPPSELPIDDRNDLAVAHDEIAWAKVSVREIGSVSTSMTPRDSFTVDLRTILQWDVSAEKRMELFITDKRAKRIVSHPVVKTLSEFCRRNNSFLGRFECSKLINIISNLFNNSLLLFIR